MRSVASPKSMRPWAEHLAAEGLTVELPRLPTLVAKVDGVPVLSENPQPIYADYCKDWMRAFLQLAMDNVGYEGGREITPEQNDRLGAAGPRPPAALPAGRAVVNWPPTNTVLPTITWSRAMPLRIMPMAFSRMPKCRVRP